MKLVTFHVRVRVHDEAQLLRELAADWGSSPRVFAQESLPDNVWEALFRERPPLDYGFEILGYESDVRDAEEED
jgi:hypothetical protein